jgi:outer membrane protein OmpA-like peptidoglycan-associated protein
MVTLVSRITVLSLLVLAELFAAQHSWSQTLSAEEIQQQLAKPRTRGMRNLQIEAVPKPVIAPAAVQENAPLNPVAPSDSAALPAIVLQPAESKPQPAPLAPLTPLAPIVPDQNSKQELEEPPQVALQIQFEFNSSKITPQGDIQIGELAKALNSKVLEGVRFQVEGHTDAVGKAEYNLKLSQQRADAIAFKLSSLGVERARLSAVGMGDLKLLSGFKPSAAEHRRVVVMARN